MGSEFSNVSWTGDPTLAASSGGCRAVGSVLRQCADFMNCGELQESTQSLGGLVKVSLPRDGNRCDFIASTEQVLASGFRGHALSACFPSRGFESESTSMLAILCSAIRFSR